MSIKIHDHTDEVLDEYEEALERALLRVGQSAERYAKEELSRPKPHADGTVRPNVDTGFLRNSITWALSGEASNISEYKADKGDKVGFYSGNAPEDEDKAVYVGTNVDYGPFVELDTSKMNAFPFLKPAATEHTDVYKRIVEDELKG